MKITSSVVTTLAMVLAIGMLAAPAAPVLAKAMPPGANTSSPSGAPPPPGSVWAWGSKGSTGLGNNIGADSKVPVQVSNLDGIVDVAAGSGHALALRSDGTVWAWGLNSQGQLGDGTSTNRYIPVQVSGLSGVVDIAAGFNHSLAVQSDGTVWAWGFRSMLGSYPVPSTGTTPVKAQITGVTSVAARENYSVARKRDGTVWHWGEVSTLPTQVSGLSEIKDIALGGQGDLALKSDGTVYNISGPAPVRVGTLTGVILVAAGYSHGLAATSDGVVWSFGLSQVPTNSVGQLGDGTNISRNAPVQVIGLKGITSIAAGKEHSLALKSDGTVWSWGYNYYGELGDGTTVNRNAPIQVTGMTGAVAIAAREYLSVAVSTSPAAVTGTAPLTPGPVPAPVTPASSPSPTSPTPISKTTGEKASPGGSIVYVSPENPRGLSPGTIFSLSIWAASGSQVISFGDLSLSFDPNSIEIISIVPGSAFGPNGKAVQNQHSNSNGTAHLTASYTSTSAAGGGASGAAQSGAAASGAISEAVAAANAAQSAASSAAQGAAAGGAIKEGTEADNAMDAISALLKKAADEQASIMANLKGGAETPTQSTQGDNVTLPAHRAAASLITPTDLTLSLGKTVSGAAYFGSPKTGYVPSVPLAVVKFRVKATAQPGDYQFSVSKAGLTDTNGQAIPVRLITASTITVGGSTKMGDLDRNGLADRGDLGIFTSTYGTAKGQQGFSGGADLNGDGLVNFLDLALFGANYGK